MVCLKHIYIKLLQSFKIEKWFWRLKRSLFYFRQAAHFSSQLPSPHTLGPLLTPFLPSYQCFSCLRLFFLASLQLFVYLTSPHRFETWPARSCGQDEFHSFLALFYYNQCPASTALSRSLPSLTRAPAAWQFWTCPYVFWTGLICWRWINWWWLRQLLGPHTEMKHWTKRPTKKNKYFINLSYNNTANKTMHCPVLLWLCQQNIHQQQQPLNWSVPGPQIQWSSRWWTRNKARLQTTISP